MNLGIIAMKLGIIAGGGQLPLDLVKTCQAENRPFHVIVLEGHARPQDFKNIPHTAVRLGAAGTTLKVLHEQEVKQVVFAGAVKRPSMAELRPDWKGLKFFTKIGFNRKGDDGLLKAVTKSMEEEGFEVVGTHQILKSILADKGMMGNITPDEGALISIEKGFQIAKELGKLDVGQAVVVQEGLVLGVEALEGTDGLIQRTAKLKREGAKPILVKVSKPQQERRMDLPTIGLKTLEELHKAGFQGVAIEAGSTIVVDKEACRAFADKDNLFIFGK